MLLVRVHGPPQVYGGVRWPECRETVQWGLQVVRDGVVVVMGVCRLCAVPRHWCKRW